MNKKKMCISFSGGETSGFMTTELLKNYQSEYDFLITFANTGRENEETLEFVRQCDEYWQLMFNKKVVWLEPVTHMQHGKGQTHKVVSFETASRKGEPYEDYIKKEGIPSMPFPQCSERLKTFSMNSYRKTVGFGVRDAITAIGIREDEKNRKSQYGIKKYNLFYPLIDWFPSDKIDVNNFWESMPFRLELESHQGNCKTCWKKSEKKLWLIALENPEWFDWDIEMEEKYKFVKHITKGGGLFEPGKFPRMFHRGNKSAKQIIKEAQNMNKETLRKMIDLEKDHSSGCGESCEPYQAQDELFN